MLTIKLNGENPVSTRFVISPIWEVMTSYSLYTLNHDRFPMYQEWLVETEKNIGGMEFPYFSALFHCQRFIPDFLTPPTTKTLTNIYDEIEAIRNTPHHVIRRDMAQIEALEGQNLSPQVKRLLGEYVETPELALERLVQEIELYWQMALARDWPRMQEILEGDILYRAKQLALGGAETVFSDLHPRIHYENATVHIEKKHPDDFPMAVEKEMVVLIPLIFSCFSPFTLIAPEWFPTLSYQPRGWGMWRSSEVLPPNDALELTVGVGRAKMLQSLATPASTGELAHRLNITAGAVSQHVARMTQAGLITSIQNGKRVYHQLTQRGELLLSLFE